MPILLRLCCLFTVRRFSSVSFESTESIMHGRVAVITGGFGVVGKTIVARFAAAGYSVAALGRAPAEVAERPGGSAATLVIGGVDLTDSAATQKAMDASVDKLGALDVLVNVAGGFRWQLFGEGDLSVWDLMYEVNLKTALVATRAALPGLLKSPSARIVNVGAGAAADRSRAGMGAYTAAKAGIQKLTESLADELKDRSVCVNAVLPGTVDTPQNRLDMPNADYSRWVAPADLAAVVLFLASVEARAVNGAALAVAGRS
jgi:NAD(P)-dependent dehydrogenase (short-subunit alcohol dehydrogenase family)